MTLNNLLVRRISSFKQLICSEIPLSYNNTIYFCRQPQCQKKNNSDNSAIKKSLKVKHLQAQWFNYNSLLNLICAKVERLNIDIDESLFNGFFDDFIPIHDRF